VAIIKSEIIQSVQARLVGDAGILALVSAENIGNYLPQNTLFPLISYETQFDTLSVKGVTDYEVTLTIEIKSRYEGSKEILQIIDAIDNAFDGIPIVIASGNCYGTFLEGYNISLDGDGVTYLGTGIYKILVSE